MRRMRPALRRSRAGTGPCVLDPSGCTKLKPHPPMTLSSVVMHSGIVCAGLGSEAQGEARWGDAHGGAGRCQGP